MPTAYGRIYVHGRNTVQGIQQRIKIVALYRKLAGGGHQKGTTAPVALLAGHFRIVRLGWWLLGYLGCRLVLVGFGFSSLRRLAAIGVLWSISPPRTDLAGTSDSLR